MVGCQEHGPFHPQHLPVMDDQSPAIDTEGGTGQYFKDPVKQLLVLREYRD